VRASGFAVGAVYGIVAVGHSLVFRPTTVTNRSGRSALQTLAIVAGLLAALAAGVVAWARS
jgi:hypothetical protein